MQTTSDQKTKVKTKLRRGPATPVSKIDKGLDLQLPADEYRTLPIPGVAGAKLGICYVKILDIPADLDNFMEINPRVPSRTKKGVLSGPIAAGILETLRDVPEEMVIKNRGIYLLAESTGFEKETGGRGILRIRFSDAGKHGIIDGGHTYAAIREAIETADLDEIKALERAYVRVHIFQGIDEDYVPEIAEGLNRSRQVDDPSLINLQGEFDLIRRVLRGTKAEKAVAYHQGDDGDVYISEILVYLSLFNLDRFDERRHPNALYNRQALGLKYFAEDLAEAKSGLNKRVALLPEILWLADSLRKVTPEAATTVNFKFGRAKLGAPDRAGSAKNKGTLLPFLGETVDYRVPNGWIYPMLASFRANLKLTDDGKLEWRVPLARILPDVIKDLVSVCVSEHRDNNLRPELIGKRESAYSQCYTKVQLYLAKKGLL